LQNSKHLKQNNSFFLLIETKNKRGQKTSPLFVI